MKTCWINYNVPFFEIIVIWNLYDFSNVVNTFKQPRDQVHSRNRVTHFWLLTDDIYHQQTTGYCQKTKCLLGEIYHRLNTDTTSLNLFECLIRKINVDSNLPERDWLCHAVECVLPRLGQGGGLRGHVVGQGAAAAPPAPTPASTSPPPTAPSPAAIRYPCEIRLH